MVAIVRNTSQSATTRTAVQIKFAFDSSGASTGYTSKKGPDRTVGPEEPINRVVEPRRWSAAQGGDHRQRVPAPALAEEPHGDARV